MDRTIKSLIIGGGIGGLAAAIALRQAGHEVMVFEQVGELKEIGAGITLWANAIKALDKLALGETIRAWSIPEMGGGVFSQRGELLAEISTAELERRFGAVSLAVHRADLQTAMQQELGEGMLQLDARLVGFEQNATEVRARFADGQEVRGDVLVGADGIHSVVQAQLFGETKPRYAGYTAWRGIAPKWHADIVAGETWGYGARFGIVPLSQERIYWFATRNAPEGERDTPSERKRELLEMFGGWHTPIRAIIEATPESAILRNDIYDREPLKCWSQGRVTLLGDAAHPMTPNLGQGACQAIEDAVVLAQCLGKVADVPAALRLYQGERLSRTSAIVIQSRRIGWIGQWENPLACWLRNTGSKLYPPRLQFKLLEPVVGYEV